jgi:hypothetical protein
MVIGQLYFPIRLQGPKREGINNVTLSTGVVVVLLDFVDSFITVLTIMAIHEINKKNASASRNGVDTVTTVLIVGAGECCLAFG